VNIFDKIWRGETYSVAGKKKGALVAITRRNREVLDYMRDFFAKNDQLPPCWKIAEYFGWASHNAAQTHISKLEAFGLIVRNEVGNFKFPSAALQTGKPGAVQEMEAA